MSRYPFARCSCGSSMLKPTERPPPSFAPRFAASITWAVRIRRSSTRLEAVRNVRRVHAEHEQRRQREVHQAHQQPAVRSDAVVLLQLRMTAELPAPPELRAGEEQDDDQDRVRP